MSGLQHINDYLARNNINRRLVRPHGPEELAAAKADPNSVIVDPGEAGLSAAWWRLTAEYPSLRGILLPKTRTVWKTPPWIKDGFEGHEQESPDNTQSVRGWDLAAVGETPEPGPVLKVLYEGPIDEIIDGPGAFEAGIQAGRHEAALTIIALSDLAHEVCDGELASEALREMASRLLNEHVHTIRQAALTIKASDEAKKAAK